MYGSFEVVHELIWVWLSVLFISLWIFQQRCPSKTSSNEFLWHVFFVVRYVLMQTGIGRKISDTNQAPIKRSDTCMYFTRFSFLSLKSLSMMSWINNLSYSFPEASPSFAPNIIIAMVVRPSVPNRVVVWPWIPNIIIATPSLWKGFHVVIHALHNPPRMSSSSICDSMASATATCIPNIDYIKIFINSSLT